MVIPYRAVATDIERLQPVVIDSGQLTEAMLASMAVPGALPPVELNGRYLVDGGPVNNMPVDVAKAMGADIVIAVDISTDYSPAAELGSYLQVMNQLVNYMVRNSTDEQIANMTNQDVLLKPQVGNMETTEFERMPEAFDKGFQAAFSQRQTLSKLALSAGEYQEYIEAKQQRRRLMLFGGMLNVDHIVIDNETSFSDSVLKARLALETGMMDSTKLETAVQNLYALDRFETVRYHIESEGDENTLMVNVREKSWGQTSLISALHWKITSSPVRIFLPGSVLTPPDCQIMALSCVPFLNLVPIKSAGGVVSAIQCRPAVLY